MGRATILVCILLTGVTTWAISACEVETVKLGAGKLRQFNAGQHPLPAVEPPEPGRLRTALEVEVTVAADADPCMVGLGVGSAFHSTPASLLVEQAVLTRVVATEPRARSIVLPWVAQSRGVLLAEGTGALAGSSWTGFTGVVSPPGPFALAAGETFSVVFVLSFDEADAEALPGLPLQFAVGGVLPDGSPDLGPAGSSDPIEYSEPGALGTCLPTATTHCLAGGRFAVDGTWRSAAGAGTALVDPWPTANSGSFYFFDPALLEAQVKVIDGSAVNGHCWVFTSAMTNVEYTLRVTDTQTGQTKTYTNPQGRAATPVQDVEAFSCGPSPP